MAANRRRMDDADSECGDLTDEHVLVGLWAGDTEVLRMLYDHDGLLAFGLAYRMLGDAAAAENVVRGAFLTMWRHADGFDLTHAQPRAWLLTTVRDRCLADRRGSTPLVRRRPRLSPEKPRLVTTFGKRQRSSDDRSGALAPPVSSPAVAAEDLERRKEETLQATAHDLKSALSAMNVSTAMLRRTGTGTVGTDADEWREWLAMTERSITRVTYLIDDLLATASRPTGQRIEPRRQPNDLVALTRQAAAERQSVCRRHRIRVEAGTEGLVGFWSTSHLMRVIDNLLQNAVKYSPDGGDIVLRVDRETDAEGVWAILVVRDQGMGIPRADLPHVFELYHRASNVDQRIQGTGIGLALVKQVVEQSGGKVTVTSEEGQGSTFTVRLPIIDEPMGPC